LVQSPHGIASVVMQVVVALPASSAFKQLEVLAMRHMIVPLLACTLLAGAALADDPSNTAASATDQQPQATINLTGGSVAAGVGWVWASGELTYQGKKYPIKLSGVSVVDVGAARITATGDVYNLTTLKDFDGNYAAATAGLTIGGGGSAAVLRNEHGVVIRLLSTTAGLRFNLSADGVSIKIAS
jgi:hypothetical protein